MLVLGEKTYSRRSYLGIGTLANQLISVNSSNAEENTEGSYYRLCRGLRLNAFPTVKKGVASYLGKMEAQQFRDVKKHLGKRDRPP